MTAPQPHSPATVAICSLVRDGMAYLPSYRRQLESLALPDGLQWRLYIVEGDSKDDSNAFLARWAAEDARVTVAREDVGDAADKEDRAARWARVGNSCFALVPPDGDHTHVLWLEADLCFPPETLHRLVDHRVDIVAPIIFLGGLFYDTWGFRDVNGGRWRNTAPYHPAYRPMDLMKMGSVGSCVLFRREVLDAGIRFRGTYENGLLVGMCNEAREKGFGVYADTATAILHPVDQWQEQMWRPSGVRCVDLNGNESSLSIAEGRQLGLEMNVPLLDAGTMRLAHFRLFRHLFTRLDTNRLAVHAIAKAQPRKSYELLIRAEPPQGLYGPRPIRRLLLSKLHVHHFAPSQDPNTGVRHQLAQRAFRFEVQTSLQEDA